MGAVKAVTILCNLLLIELVSGKGIRCNVLQNSAACGFPPPLGVSDFWWYGEDDLVSATRAFQNLPKSELAGVSAELASDTGVANVPMVVRGTLTLTCDKAFLDKEAGAGKGACDLFIWTYQCGGCTAGSLNSQLAAGLLSDDWETSRCKSSFVLDASVPTASHRFTVFHREVSPGATVTVTLPDNLHFTRWGRRYRDTHCSVLGDKQACEAQPDCLYHQGEAKCKPRLCSSFQGPSAPKSGGGGGGYQHNKCATCVADEKAHIDSQIQSFPGFP